MRKIFPLLLLAAIVVALWFFSPFREKGGAGQTVTNLSKPPKTGNSNPNGPTPNGGTTGTDGADISIDLDDPLSGVDTGEAARPAAEAYKTADEALEAIKKGSLSYDDVILEQFTEPGDDCTWCDKFYPALRDLMHSQDITADQRSYFAEILAVSGRTENVMSLVDAIKNAPSQDLADVYAEALELTVGKDDVIKALSGELKSSSQTLKEAVIGAITNQGSRLAVETLYATTTESGDPNGFYDIGLGLGEVVPEEEAYPFLQEAVNKRDQYSHLAVKSLLNSGLPGVKLVMESLTGSKDADFDKQMLKDARDHVVYDEDTKKFLEEYVKTTKDKTAAEFANGVLQDFKDEAVDASQQ